MIGVIPRWLSGSGDPELLKLVPGLERCDEPTRLFAATGPGFLRDRWIIVSRQDFGISAPWRTVFLLLGGRALGLADRLSPAKLRETPFKFELFRADFFREDLRELLVQKPELIKIHDF